MSILEDIILNEELTQKDIKHIKSQSTRVGRRNAERAARMGELADARKYSD